MEPDFPSLADEIAEPHPDMNNKVAAFTVSEKSSNTVIIASNRSVGKPSLLKHEASLRLVESTAFVEVALKHTKEEAIECTYIRTRLNNIVMLKRLTQ